MTKPMSPHGDSAKALLEALGLLDKHVCKLQLTMQPDAIVTVDVEMEVQDIPGDEWKRLLSRYVLVERDEYVQRTCTGADAQRIDHMEQTRRYPFPNVGKWTMRVGPESTKAGGHWVHGATLRECLDKAIEASRGLG